LSEKPVIGQVEPIDPLEFRGRFSFPPSEGKAREGAEVGEACIPLDIRQELGSFSFCESRGECRQVPTYSRERSICLSWRTLALESMHKGWIRAEWELPRTIVRLSTIP
jgi:hypothetical protein